MGKNLSLTLSNLKKKYAGSIKDVTEAAVVHKLYLDSPQLNYMFGGGFPHGRIIQLHGPESSGKSTLSTYVAGQIQKKAKQKVIVYVDFERTFEAAYAENLGLDTQENFIFLRPEDGEEAFTILEELIRTGEIGLIIWDSDTTTGSRSQMTDEYGKASFGGSAKVFADGLRKFNPLIDKFQTSMIIISQERDNIGAMYGPDFKVTGGRAIKFYATNRSRITRTGYITEKGETTGIEMKVKNGKNKAGIPFRTAELRLMFKGGFDVEQEYIDFLILLKLVTQAGAYFRSEKYNFNLQGRAKLQEWLDSHPVEYEELKLLVNNTLSGVVEELDAANAANEEEAELAMMAGALGTDGSDDDIPVIRE
jgi:recombination protein RecA